MSVSLKGNRIPFFKTFPDPTATKQPRLIEVSLRSRRHSSFECAYGKRERRKGATRGVFKKYTDAC